MRELPGPSRPSQIDAELMRQSQLGNTDAFAELYDRHASRAHTMVRSMCHNLSQTEEVVQDGFFLIWANRAKFQSDRGTFQAWSKGIFRNRAIDSIRARSARPEGVEISEPIKDVNGISPADEVERRNESDLLKASLRLIPRAQAEVISLAFFGELSQTEIAELLQLPKGTVKGRMRLGMQKLRRDLSEDASPVASRNSLE